MRYFWRKFEGNVDADPNTYSRTVHATLKAALSNAPVAASGERYLLTRDNGRRFETVLPEVAVYGGAL